MIQRDSGVLLDSRCIGALFAVLGRSEAAGASA
jgi:hypothetical protein